MKAQPAIHPSRENNDVRKIKNQVRQIVYLMRENVKALATHEALYKAATRADTAINEYYLIEEGRRNLKEVLSHFDTAYSSGKRFIRTKDKVTGGFEWLDCSSSCFRQKINEFFPHYSSHFGLPIDRVSIREYKDDSEGFGRTYTHPAVKYKREWLIAEQARRDGLETRFRIHEANRNSGRPKDRPPWLIQPAQQFQRHAEIDRRRGKSAPSTVRLTEAANVP